MLRLLVATVVVCLVESLGPLMAVDIDRRGFLSTPPAVAAAAGSLLLAPKSALAAEWSVGIYGSKWVVKEKVATSISPRVQTMLSATDKYNKDIEMKLLRLPLGRDLSATLPLEDQARLATFFSGAKAERCAPEQAVAVMGGVLKRQTADPASPLQYGAMLPGGSTSAVTSRDGRRYLSYQFETDACTRIDEDGACIEPRLQRRTLAVLTATRGLRAPKAASFMERSAGFSIKEDYEPGGLVADLNGALTEEDITARAMDVVWLLTVSAPPGDFNAEALRKTTDTFTVDDPDLVPS